MKKVKGFSLKEVILIIVATSLITSMTTGIIVYNQNKLTKNLTYKDLADDQTLNEFLKVYASLIDEYYEDVDKSKLLESAINAMFNYLGEDYSTYMSKDETNTLTEQLDGEYTGIGISLNVENEIVGFIEGGTAKNSGLEIGDKIIAVNNVDVTEMNSKKLADIIGKSKLGEKIQIIVNRGEEKLTFEVENKKIIIPAVSQKLLEENIGYLKITTFSNTLKDQVSSALEEIENQGINSLIIDLRDNTGGYLSSAKDVASMFLEKGDVIYSLEEKGKEKKYRDTTDEKKEYKIILLCNQRSASASEILIAALKDNNKAIIVGTTTYGKGKVQQTHALENGGMVKYTSAKWLRPNGECIDGVGIEPDYIVENSEETMEDKQLEKAMELARE